MIGRKKLSTIRQELQRALAATGDDPIHWLEERMAVPPGQGTATPGENEVLQSLRRILERAGRQRQRAGTRK
jgi:hypothetical protein